MFNQVFEKLLIDAASSGMSSGHIASRWGFPLGYVSMVILLIVV
jgi:hypothetical protein